jgi:hypothetical protein
MWGGVWDINFGKFWDYIVFRNNIIPEVTLYNSSVSVEQTGNFRYCIIGQGCCFPILFLNSSEVCAVNMWLPCMVTERKDKIVKINSFFAVFSYTKQGLLARMCSSLASAGYKVV